MEQVFDTLSKTEDIPLFKIADYNFLQSFPQFKEITKQRCWVFTKGEIEKYNFTFQFNKKKHEKFFNIGKNK